MILISKLKKHITKSTVQKYALKTQELCQHESIVCLGVLGASFPAISY